MTPDRRLDQVEPALAEGLQKIDRLVNGQGKLVDLATSTDRKADTTAKGVANLTLKVDRLTDNQASLTTKVDQLTDDQTSLRQEMQKNIAQVDRKVDNLRTEMNQRFDELITLIRERLS